MHKLLFLDHMLLESVKGCRRDFRPAKKCSLNPLLKPEYPHEYSSVHLSGSVIRACDTGLYKMWYLTTHIEEGTFLCLATSKDGIEWHKPSLDVVPGTNIVMKQEEHVHGPSIIYDKDEAREDWRYKLLMYPLGLKKAIQAYRSADGIHWINANGGVPVMREFSDCHIGLCRNHNTKQYVATLRQKISRRIWLSTSENFIDWSEPNLIFEPAIEDQEGLEFYGMPVFSYGPFMMGSLSRFFTDPEEKSWRKMRGPTDIALSFSRGTSCWKMVERKQALISNGQKGEWDEGTIYPASAPVFDGGNIHYFYSGRPCLHGENSPNAQRCIGRATIEIDRWVGLSADAAQGEIVTKIFKLQDAGLKVNALVPEGGILQVALADEHWQDMPGFCFEDCLPLSGDCRNAEVQWKNSPQWSSILGKNIRVKIVLRNATLFALYFPNGVTAENDADFFEFTGTGLDFSDENMSILEI